MRGLRQRVNLKAIDNVRPLSQVVSWIYHRIRSTEHPEVREALDIELVRHWKNDGTIWASIFRLLSNPWVGTIGRKG